MSTLDPEAVKRAGDVCKSCRAEIIWATTRPRDPTKTGKPMPIDPELVVGGNIALSVDDAGMLIARHVPPAPTVEAYVAHFSTCPNADEFRKPAEGASHDEQNAARRRALLVRMPFGQYAGLTLEAIDRESAGHRYLAWSISRQGIEWRRTDVRDAIRTVLGVDA